MARLPRAEVINRTVRRSFLLGDDPFLRKNFDHRCYSLTESWTGPEARYVEFRGLTCFKSAGVSSPAEIADLGQAFEELEGSRPAANRFASALGSAVIDLELTGGPLRGTDCEEVTELLVGMILFFG